MSSNFGRVDDTDVDDTDVGDDEGKKRYDLSYDNTSAYKLNFRQLGLG